MLTISAILLGFATAGGAVDTRALQNRIEFIKQRPGSPVEPLPMISAPKLPDSQTVRNPFVMSSTPRDATEDGPILTDDQPKVLRIVESTNETVALMSYAQDAVRVVRLGDHVGNASVEMVSQSGLTLRHPDGSTSVLAPVK